MKFTRKYPATMPGASPAPGLVLAPNLGACAGCGAGTGWMSMPLAAWVCGETCMAAVAITLGRFRVVDPDPEPMPPPAACQTFVVLA